MSSVIVFSLMIPLLMLMIIMCSRYVQRKNMEEEAKEKELYLTELEKQRQKVFELLHKDHQREAEIELFLEQQLKDEEFNKVRPTHLSLNVVHKAEISLKSSDALSTNNYNQDSTDDEFFEPPLPPIPIPSTSKIQETFNSDDDNNPSVSPRKYKQFSPPPNFPPPSPPLSASPLPDLFSKETTFNPLVLSPVSSSLSTPSSPICKALSSNSSFNDTQKPKKFMQSDF
ncbi:unnamed protein product [Diamesa serratosioi]